MFACAESNISFVGRLKAISKLRLTSIFGLTKSCIVFSTKQQTILVHPSTTKIASKLLKILFLTFYTKAKEAKHAKLKKATLTVRNNK